MLSTRQISIFKTIVEEFTRSAEPVGSKNLMNILEFSCSSATIRNEMAMLEEEGLLEKTHTSSGRIPSSKGYRYYVENLMERELEEDVKDSLITVFKERHYSLDEIVKKSCDILSQMTHLTSVVLGPDASAQTLAHIQLVPINERSAVAIFITNNGHTENKIFEFEREVSIKDLQTCTQILNEKLVGTRLSEVLEKMNDLEPLLAAHISRHEILFQAFVSAFVKFASDNVYCSGQSNMLYHPEFADIEKLKQLMSMLEDSTLWRQIGHSDGDMTIRIGSNELIASDDISVVSSKFTLGDGEEGQLMVVGPTRMPYNKVVALCEFMSKAIEEMFKNEN
ncbi:MAG: heat-inducible transcriptional repressor HrcA [Erysipelotrichaceae bacterium]